LPVYPIRNVRWKYKEIVEMSLRHRNDLDDQAERPV
jgi:hypothetical protein